MSLLSAFLASQQAKSSNVRSAIQAVYIAIMALAIFLAIKDLNLLQHTSTKVWVMLLAIMTPELYVILHGISSSSIGVNFFSGSPVEAHMGSVSSAFKDAVGEARHPDPSRFQAPPPPEMSTTPSETSSSLF